MHAGVILFDDQWEFLINIQSDKTQEEREEKESVCACALHVFYFLNKNLVNTACSNAALSSSLGDKLGASGITNIATDSCTGVPLLTTTT